MMTALRRLFYDPSVLVALLVAGVIIGDMGKALLQPQHARHDDWPAHAHCVELAHNIIDYGSMPSERFRQDDCPESVWAGVVCGWIDDEECQRRLRHRPSP